MKTHPKTNATNDTPSVCSPTGSAYISLPLANYIDIAVVQMCLVGVEFNHMFHRYDIDLLTSPVDGWSSDQASSTDKLRKI